MALVLVLQPSFKALVTCLLDATRDPEEGKQAYEKDNCPLLVIILASLVAVLSVALLIFGVCLLSWRKKQRKGNLLSYLYNMSAGCHCLISVF